MRAAPALLALMLAACTPDLAPGPLPNDPPPLPDPAGACGAADLQDLQGRPARVLHSLRFAQPVRVIRPGQAVTMEYNPARLNIEIDAAERIARLSCG